ncbi:unnamed protein product [Heterosigma akashiwo]
MSMIMSDLSPAVKGSKLCFSAISNWAISGCPCTFFFVSFLRRRCSASISISFCLALTTMKRSPLHFLESGRSLSFLTKRPCFESSSFTHSRSFSTFSSSSPGNVRTKN